MQKNQSSNNVLVAALRILVGSQSWVVLLLEFIHEKTKEVVVIALAQNIGLGEKKAVYVCVWSTRRRQLVGAVL